MFENLGMFETIFVLSSWITASLLVSLAWFIYKYSKNFVVEVNYWKYICEGILFLAVSEIARPLHLFADDFFQIYLVLSIFGSVVLAYGFYMLYQAEHV